MDCVKCVLALVLMTLSLTTLNTRGCSSSIKNASLYTYIESVCNKPDIVLLQETSVSNEQSFIRTWPSYSSYCNPSPTRGSGVVTLVKNNINVAESKILYDGYLSCTKISLNNVIFYVHNILMPQSNSEALKVIDKLSENSDSCSDGVSIVAGDFNCTLNPSLDRLNMPSEHRQRIVKPLKKVLSDFQVSDVWRKQNPEEQKFTWYRNNPQSAVNFSKARLDRIYIHSSMLSSCSQCKILTCPLSDHSAVTLGLKLPSKSHIGSAYWHFNNALLNDKEYQDIIREFWLSWKNEKGDFPNICDWWDFGKIHMKTITQMYASKVASMKKEALTIINESIEKISSKTEFDHETETLLNEQRNEMKKILTNKAQGALIRSRFQHANEIDTCSSYFFTLEKSHTLSKCMSKIRLTSGEITDNPAEIKKHVHEFYKSLYDRAKISDHSLKKILGNLNKLNLEDSEHLDAPPSLEELSEAVKNLGKNKTPGLDGLTTEFYQFFWPLFKNDFLLVISKICETGASPQSFRRAVITLLPKKGDLSDIKNWRPVSLLNTDYKIFARTLSNRLTKCIDSVIHPDQSYCIPGRTIYDNISLIRDVIMYSNWNNIPAAVVNLDQRKAFDNVDHTYLFKTMKHMGFGDRFITYIQSLYKDAESVIKICGSLTSPFSFSKGIRQGCPLSGLLYTIAIEPFLNSLRNELQGQSFALPNSTNFCAVSAYADDVSIFITSDSGFKAIEEIYDLYSRASAASLNLQKSQGLWVGQWTKRSDTPLGFKWNSQGLLFLGVHIGNTHTHTQQNWNNCKDKLSKTFSKWMFLSSSLSLKGKVLIANQLAASKVNHILAGLSPPENIIRELQGMIVDFVWSNKRHFLRQQILFQKPDQGGLGLVCLQARMLAYRFTTLQRFLARNNHPAYTMIGYFLRQYKKLGLDQNLFHTELDPKFFFSVPLYHSDLLRAWIVSGAHTFTPPGLINYVIDLPINSIILKLSADSEETCNRLIACGVRTVRSTINALDGNWLSPLDIVEASSQPPLRCPSLRTLGSHLHIVQNRLCKNFPMLFDSAGLIAAKDRLQKIATVAEPIIFTVDPDLNGQSLRTKQIYETMNKNVNHLATPTITYWHDKMIIDEKYVINWKGIYKLPASKKEGDTQFKLIHNALMSLPALHHCNSSISSLCGWCGEKGTLIHVFIRCPSIQPALDLLYKLICSILPDLDIVFETYWCLIPHCRSRNRESVNLANFLIVSLKHVIYWCCISTKFPNPLTIWTHRLKSKILVEYHYYRLNGNLTSFNKKWNINNSLFTMIDDKMTWMV